jgi:4-amino-4-deoxy-L-arabinose transferase-like glycosyltransferase
LDEAYTVYPAQLPIRQLFHFLASLEHPPFYFLLLSLWIEVAGSTPFAMRYLSVLFGTLGVVGLYVLARHLWNRRVAAIAALLLAVSPFHIWHSQDIRMYEPLFVCSLFSTYFLVRGLKDPREGGGKSTFLWGNRFWIGYILAALVSLYTLNIAVFVELAHVLMGALAVILRRPHTRKNAKKFVISLVMIGIGYLPWLPILLIQAKHVNQYFWIPRPTWTTLRGTLLNFYSGFLFSNSPWHPRLGHWPANSLYVPLLVLLLLGIWYGRRSPFAILSSLILWLVPMGVVYALSQIKPTYLDRTVLPASIGLFMLWAAGATEARHRLLSWLSLVTVVAMLAANILSLSNLYTGAEKEEWNEAAAIVARNSQPGDVVLVDSGLNQIAFGYYFERYETGVPTYGFPLDNDHWRIQEVKLRSRWWIQDFIEFDWSQAEPRLESLIQDADRIWLVVNRPLGGERLQNWINQRFDHSFAFEVNRIQVMLYTNSGGDKIDG